MNVKENSKQNLEKKPLENISQLIDKDRNFVKKHEKINQQSTLFGNILSLINNLPCLGFQY